MVTLKMPTFILNLSNSVIQCLHPFLGQYNDFRIFNYKYSLHDTNVISVLSLIIILKSHKALFMLLLFIVKGIFDLHALFTMFSPLSFPES